MYKIFLFIIFSLFTTLVFADCQLLSQPIKQRVLKGTFYIANMNPGLISFDKKHGDLSNNNQKLSLDRLYEIQGDGGISRFRFGERFFANGATHLGMLQLEMGSKPLKSGSYKLYSLITTNVQHVQSLTMIGDSITWWSFGNSFRCLLSPYLASTTFTGPHTDSFGYDHAGEGGDTSQDILRRLSSIGDSNYYFLLAGTNDWQGSLTPDKTFANIKSISKTLSLRGGIVIVSTILPRLDEHDVRNQKVNNLLREWAGSDCSCSVVELDFYFRNLPNVKDLYWDAGVHPNVNGYKKMAKVLGPQINRIVKKNKTH
jgi:lysophospholipase L1-like esterase